MEQIKDTVQKVISECKRRRLDNKDIMRAFNQAFSKTESKHMKFISCRKNVCVVNVDTSGWLYHLSLKKEKAKILINKELGSKGGSSAIDDIRFRIGEV